MSENEFSLPKVGEVVAGKYRVERLLGQGGMGAVYQAHHEILNQKVALKYLLPAVGQNPQAVSRFLNEARAAAQIQNEHVAKVLDVDSSPNGSAYMVLEFLEGVDLAALQQARGTGLPVAEVVDYILQALEAVAQAHACGIVHRDLKPANLFLARRFDGSSCIKVLDFGISKAADAASGLTATNSVLGSPYFMSPEQIRNSKGVDPRADIWSIGVILYKLLTNELPFGGDNFGEIFIAILEKDPPSVCSVRPDLPESLDTIIKSCLQRDRELRYANVSQLAQDLAPCALLEARQSVERIRRTLASAPARPRPPETTPAPAPAAKPPSADAGTSAPRVVVDMTGEDHAARPATPPPAGDDAGMESGATSIRATPSSKDLSKDKPAQPAAAEPAPEGLSTGEKALVTPLWKRPAALGIAAAVVLAIVGAVAIPMMKGEPAAPAQPVTFAPDPKAPTAAAEEARKAEEAKAKIEAEAKALAEAKAKAEAEAAALAEAKAKAEAEAAALAEAKAKAEAEAKALAEARAKSTATRPTPARKQTPAPKAEEPAAAGDMLLDRN